MADQGFKGATIISNQTYDLLAVLLSKLEGLEAYEQYVDDLDGESKQIIEQIRRDDERHAQLLQQHIERLVRQNGFK